MSVRIFIIVLVSFGHSIGHGATATIATASNFKSTMDELIPLYQQHYPHSVRQVNASSGVLFNQIVFGAPFDLFLSADARYPTALQQRMSGIGKATTYAIGKLVMVVNDNNKPPPIVSETAVINTLSTLTGKIAIANPDIAPYGLAAHQVIAHLGLWDSLQSRLIRGNNVGQAFQFIATKNATLGFVAQSQALYFKTEELSIWPLPISWYQPIRQQAILLQSGQQNPAARSFLEFLTTADAQSIIRKHGYLSP